MQEVGPILRKNPEFKRRVFCFIGSLLGHALVLLALIVFFQPLEIPLEEGITEVIITPQQDLLIPQLERFLSGRNLGAAPESEENIPPAAGSRGPESSGVPSSEPKMPEVSADRAPTPLPAFSQGFELTASAEKSKGFNLNIAPSKDVSPDPEDYLTENERDLLRYLSSASSAQRPLGSSPSTETYGARITSSGMASFDINQIDISPWARDVVEKIQTNWAIPTSQDISAKSVVEITVSIGKNGDLQNVGIRNSSAYPTLDQAALYAVRMSAPFPSLPDSFPNENLEVHFLFRYNE